MISILMEGFALSKPVPEGAKQKPLGILVMEGEIAANPVMEGKFE
jgi:hypothetical protein